MANRDEEYQVVYFDLETSGLDPVENGILEIGAVIQKAGVKVRRFESFANPGPTKEYNPKALEVNNIELESIAGFRDLAEVLRDFDQYIEDRAVLAGWNVGGFDIPFLKAAYKAADIKWRFHYHYLDIMVVANWLKWAGKLHCRGLSLQAVAKYLEIDASQFGEAHRAMPDVWTTIAVSQRLKEDNLEGRSFKF